MFLSPHPSSPFRAAQGAIFWASTRRRILASRTPHLEAISLFAPFARCLYCTPSLGRLLFGLFLMSGNAHATVSQPPRAFFLSLFSFSFHLLMFSAAQQHVQRHGYQTALGGAVVNSQRHSWLLRRGPAYTFYWGSLPPFFLSLQHLPVRCASRRCILVVGDACNQVVPFLLSSSGLFFHFHLLASVRSIFDWISFTSWVLSDMFD
ncbi:hypothetical protein DFH06DRAFT_196734 [Mycena polygramma]|nr:hypothetical protein DFH06DRAFT_196734 [Mycena polygramma]